MTGPVDPERMIASHVFKRSLANFARPTGSDLLARTQPLHDWIEARRAMMVWPFTRSLNTAPLPQAEGKDDCGRELSGINFSSQDYLGLSQHPDVKAAAADALVVWGPHSASSAALQGSTALSVQLGRELGDLVQTEHVVLFPTGWGAGYGVVTALVRPYDYVVMDNLSHSCLQHGASAATQRVLRHDHLDVEGAALLLHRIREDSADAGILVITESLFSMDSDVPRIEALQAVCREHGATLLVDTAHDLGAIGPRGTGMLGVQAMLGKVDLVMGSFSKTFASNGGFLATHSPAVAEFIRCFGSPSTFSNALSPLQTAVVRAALKVVTSEEGDRLRERSMAAIEHMRNALAGVGATCLGIPSPIVPVLVGDEAVGRLAYRLLRDRGVLVNFVEFPGVARGAARFRVQMMASHSPDQIARAAVIVSNAIAEARAMCAKAAATPRAVSDKKETSPGSSIAAASEPPDSLQHKLFSRGERVKFSPGHTIIGEGHPGGAIYYIVSGTAEVEASHLGTPVRLNELATGDVFGEMSFLTGSAASASVIARTPIECYRIDHPTLERMTAANPEFAAHFYRYVASRLASRLRLSNENLQTLNHLMANAG